MGTFINTIEQFGEESTLDSIIDGSITEFNDDMLTTIRSFGLSSLGDLTSVNLPSLVTVSTNTFQSCSRLERVDLKSATTIAGYAFHSCFKLKAVILRSETMCHIVVSTGYPYVLKNGGTGYTYVPKKLYEQYVSSYPDCSTQFRALEDYTVDGTIYGELDKSKI